MHTTLWWQLTDDPKILWTADLMTLITIIFEFKFVWVAMIITINFEFWLIDKWVYYLLGPTCVSLEWNGCRPNQGDTCTSFRITCQDVCHVTLKTRPQLSIIAAGRFLIRVDLRFRRVIICSSPLVHGKCIQWSHNFIHSIIHTHTQTHTHTHAHSNTHTHTHISLIRLDLFSDISPVCRLYLMTS